MPPSEPHPELSALAALVGDWSTEATHPMFPGLVVAGHTTFEWLEGERFLIQRSRADHPDFPDSISIIGAPEEALEMHYYDSRGVARVYGIGMRDGALTMWRDAPGFSQRFRGELSDDGTTLAGLWELSQDDETWNADLEITFRRTP